MPSPRPPGEATRWAWCQAGAALTLQVRAGGGGFVGVGVRYCHARLVTSRNLGPTPCLTSACVLKRSGLPQRALDNH